MRSLKRSERMKTGRVNARENRGRVIKEVEFICPKEVAQEFPSSLSAARCPSSNLTLTQLYWVSISPGGCFLGMQAEASNSRAKSVTVYNALSLLLRVLSRARSSEGFLPRILDVWTRSAGGKMAC